MPSKKAAIGNERFLPDNRTAQHPTLAIDEFGCGVYHDTRTQFDGAL